MAVCEGSVEVCVLLQMNNSLKQVGGNEYCS